MLYDSMNPWSTTPYQPTATNTYSTNPLVGPAQGDTLIKVNGLDSARAYPTKPNSRYALFDANDDILYIKTTDASNFPTIERYRFTKESLYDETTNTRYVTLDEFEKFKKEILDGQQSIRSKRHNANRPGNRDTTESIEYDED